MSSTNMRLSASALYRSIMKAHKKYLPDQMRRLGDAYVKSEFKSHKEVKKTEQLEEFFSAWEQYLSQIQEAARAKESLSAGSLTERAFSAATMSNSVGSFGKDGSNMYVTGLLPGGPICGKGKDDLNHDPHGVTGGVSAYYILHITGH